VRRRPLIGEKLSDLVVVKGAVQAQTLALRGSRRGPRDRGDSRVPLSSLRPLRFAPGVMNPDRDTSGVGENRVLRPS